MTFAYIVLYLWPLLVVFLFRRYSLPKAAAWSVIAGYLFLPGDIGLNLPVLPNLNKEFLPSAVALLIGAIALRNPSKTAGLQIPPGWLPRPMILRLLLLLLFVGMFMTARTNGQAQRIAERVLQGLTTYDAFSTSLFMLVSLLPFFLARKFLADPESHKTLLWILCLAGLIYSIPTLYEVRMSPQLQKTIYGYSVSGWRTNLRGGGFRPYVFLQHGLWLAIFMACSFLAALAYMRATGSARRSKMAAAAIWLLVTLVLVKSLGALLIALILLPVILFFDVRLQLVTAALIAMLFLTYPALRGAGLVPVDQVVSLIEKIDTGRASSLGFRLRNEDLLLEKANQKPLFGWGGWGRSRVFDEKGRNVSVTDGRWIIVIGQGGWARYVAEFGLLTMPILLLALRRREYDLTLATSGLCLVLAANLVDLIPNATETPVTWLIAGALAGRLELQRIRAVTPQPVAAAAPISRYSRRPQPADPNPEPVARQRSSGVRYTRQKPVKPAPDERQT